MAQTRRRVLEHVENGGAPTGGDDDPLLRDGYVYNMVLQHEYQHNETILQTLQLKRRPAIPRPARHRHAPRPPRARRRRRRWCASPAGAWRSAPTTGPRPTTTSARRTPWSSKPFRIDAWPVTNGEYARFIDDGGYDRRELWSEAGWAWQEEAGLVAPKFWHREDGRWMTRSMDRELPVDPERPVCHVC